MNGDQDLIHFGERDRIEQIIESFIAMLDYKMRLVSGMNGDQDLIDLGERDRIEQIIESFITVLEYKIGMG